VVVHEIPAEDEDAEDLALVGWGLQMSNRTIFVWSGTDADDQSAMGLFSSADRVLSMVEMIGLARLVWIEPHELTAKPAIRDHWKQR
jgi:hypothetical protein